MSKHFITKQQIVENTRKLFANDIIYNWDDDISIEDILLNINNSYHSEDLMADIPIVIELGYNDINYQLLNKLDAVDKNNIILEISNLLLTNDECLNILKELKKKAYNFIIKITTVDKKYKRVNAYADYVKFNVHNIPNAIIDINSDLDNLIPRIAYNVDTPEDYKTAEEFKASLFEGVYISNNVKVPLNIVSGSATTINLIDKIYNSNDKETICKYIKLDSYIVYQLLKITNSESIENVIDKLGINNTKNKLLLLKYGKSYNNNEEIISSYLRADLGQDLVIKYNIDNINPSKMYEVGLLSNIDAIMQEPLNTLLDKINIDKDVKNAILYRNNTYGLLLNTLISYESSDLETCKEFASKLGIKIADIEKHYYRAIEKVRNNRW